MKNLYLDKDYRTAGVDHLDQYRDSVFYPLLNRSVKEKGNAYEHIAAQVLTESNGADAKVVAASHGGYDLIVDGDKIELKGSRKASRYDTRARTYQFPCIRENGDYDAIMLMVIRPTDVVEIYQTTFERLVPYLRPTDKVKSSWNLAYDPDTIDATKIASVSFT